MVVVSGRECGGGSCGRDFGEKSAALYQILRLARAAFDKAFSIQLCPRLNSLLNYEVYGVFVTDK